MNFPRTYNKLILRDSFIHSREMLALMLVVSSVSGGSPGSNTATTNTNLVPVSGWQLPHPTVPLQTKQHEIHGSMSYKLGPEVGAVLN